MNIRHYLIIILSLTLSQLAMAHKGVKKEGKRTAKTIKTQSNQAARYRSDCAIAEAQIDMSINNVRARLLTGGDVWWNGSTDGLYIVPKVVPGSGVTEKSSIFAGAVWLGGFDPGGNLKVAAQTYSQEGEDFWPGPLDPDEGSIEADDCENWDRFFRVTGREIDEHLRNFELAKNAGAEYDENLIPENVKSWPSRGNPYFFEIQGFELPNTTQGLAAFFDADGDELYDPQKGDYPRIEVRGCDVPQYPDEMIFWIYNDNGNTHTATNANAIQMEVQVQAFAYATNDEINDMTFQRYKLINRAVESIDSTYFAIWVDADLGCPDDDFVGCDVGRSLAYVYNRDAIDGIVGCECNVSGDQVNTYCDEVPLLGVDYFRGPNGPKVFTDDGGLRNPAIGEAIDTIVELPMSSFTYFLRDNTTSNPDVQGDPTVGNEYYNLLSGRWKNGTPFTFGGDGFNLNSTNEIPFAFPDRPDDPTGWSMVNENLEGFDTRTVQASGPFRLDPGRVNELIIGVVWVPDVQHPNPNIDALLFADDVAQALFDNCFDITDGPDAPDVDWIELDKEIIAIFTNDVNTSNNANEAYAEVDLQAPVSLPEEERTYLFEGYKLFQLSSPNVSVAELDDPDKARIIYQVDKKNGISEIFNWFPVSNPSANPSDPNQIWVPESQVQGQDDGIRHTFRITEDQFADGDRSLINQKKYYFTAIAYAYNNYQEFTQFPNVIGQRKSYLEGRRNIGDGTNPYYTVIPREIVYENLNATYGSGAEITRIDGVGAGGVFLDMKEETLVAILDGSFTGEIEYKSGNGPINIQIYNPLEVQNGEFQLTFVDENMNNSRLDKEVNWILTDLSDGTEIASAVTIDELNEQIIGEYGFSISIVQSEEAGEEGRGSNGAIGAVVDYQDISGSQWLSNIPENRIYPFNYLQTSPGEAYEFYDSRSETDDPVDQDGALANISGGLFFPFLFADYEDRSDLPPNNFGLVPLNSYLSPAWHGDQGLDLVRLNSDIENLNNVDIVFTKDKSLWSRCVVVETATPYYYDDNRFLGIPTEGEAENFDVRNIPSVGKEAGDDGLPAPDGATDEDGRPLVGMGWFPGYAIDVETGKRLNIFFGENSTYRPDNFVIEGLEANFLGEQPRGGDMAFNPSNTLIIDTNDPTIFDYYGGGQHYVYVTDSEYDECEAIRRRLDPRLVSDETKKVKRALERITWTGMLMAAEGTQMLSYADGLIPNDVTIKLRVENPYAVEEGTGEFNGYPTYRIKLDNVAATEKETVAEMDEALENIKAVPNPYLGFSSYETSQFTNTVKITNLPANATVTIYSLDGRFIRQYKRNEAGRVITGSNRAIARQQITPALEWDLKNSKGIPIASGVYMIHIDAPGIGERVLKWFGVQRQFDPSGL